MMDTVFFIGYSGHSYVCIEIAKKNNINIGGYFDKEIKAKNPFELKYLGSEENLSNEIVHISIGDNHIRERVFNKISNPGLSLINLIDSSSIQSNSISLGLNVLLCAGSIINCLSKIEDGVIVNTGAIIEHECEIGQFSHIAPGAVLLGNVKIGKRCFIGANSVIKQGISICDNVTIGMGAVVTKDITEPGTYVGAPAKKLLKK